MKLSLTVVSRLTALLIASLVEITAAETFGGVVGGRILPGANGDYLERGRVTVG